MNWLAKIFYRGRVSRLEAVQSAAKLMALGRVEEAEQLLDRNAPTRFLMDVAVYHFVKGRVAMAKGAWKSAEQHLLASRALGIESSSLHLCIGILEARRHRPSEAREELQTAMEASAGGEEKDQEGAPQILAMLDAQKEGESLKALKARAEGFSKKKLDGALNKPALDQTQAEKALGGLEAYLEQQKSGQPLGEEKREDAAAALGEVFHRWKSAQWVFGLDMRDHLVALEGVARCPYDEVNQFLDGEREELDLFRALNTSR